MVEQAQANPQGLMPIGAVAAHNIAAMLNLSTEHVGTIETAIRDEINAMSSHFTLAMADVQTQYEVETATLKTKYEKDVVTIQDAYVASVALIKSDWVWLEANKFFASAMLGAAAIIGAFFAKVL